MRGIFRDGQAASRVVTEIEARRGVLVASPSVSKALILKNKEASGKCPNVMITSDSAGMMAGFAFISRRLPAPIRALIHKG